MWFLRRMCMCVLPDQAGRSAAACTGCSAACSGGAAAPQTARARPCCPGTARARPCCAQGPRARRCPSCGTSSTRSTRRRAPRPASLRTAAARGRCPPRTTTSRCGLAGHATPCGGMRWHAGTSTAPDEALMDNSCPGMLPLTVPPRGRFGRRLRRAAPTQGLLRVCCMHASVWRLPTQASDAALLAHPRR